jgi:hypothetical protein
LQNYDIYYLSHWLQKIRYAEFKWLFLIGVLIMPLVLLRGAGLARRTTPDELNCLAWRHNTQALLTEN